MGLMRAGGLGCAVMSNICMVNLLDAPTDDHLQKLPSINIYFSVVGVVWES